MPIAPPAALRLLLKPWLFPRTILRQLRTSVPASSPNDSNNGNKPADPKVLFDELFPELSSPLDGPLQTIRHSRRLDLSDLLEEEETSKGPQGGTGHEERASRAARERQRASTRASLIRFIEVQVKAARSGEGQAGKGSQAKFKGPATGDVGGVLVLHSASTSLTESDFRRVVPRGKHIGEWTQGDILKIIPGRDPATLAHLGFYILLFSTPNAAHAYEREAVRLHILSKRHTPTTIGSALLPPPGYLVDGMDVHAQVKAYTLVPPAQRLMLKSLRWPLPKIVQDVMRERGYPRLVRREVDTAHAVRFVVEGLWLSTGKVRKAIEDAAARERLVGWDYVEGQEAVLEVDPSFARSGSVVEKEGEEVWGGEEGGHEGREAVEGWSPMRWIIAFKSDAEARRFVRAWHRRPFPVGNGRQGPLVRVEMLW